MQLIAGIRRVRLADDLRIKRRPGINVDHGDGVRKVAHRREQGDIGKRLGWRLGRQARRGIKGGDRLSIGSLGVSVRGVFAARTDLGNTRQEISEKTHHVECEYGMEWSRCASREDRFAFFQKKEGPPPISEQPFHCRPRPLLGRLGRRYPVLTSQEAMVQVM
jgi:hypothetical protein